MDACTTKVGCRFVHSNHIGTVCYEGHLEGNEDLWLGVEWDDPSRGKHDGVHNGVRYFQTSHATSGSFIKPSKADFGITYVAAVIEKYKHEKAEADHVTFISTKPVELIGMDKISEKQSQLHELKTIAVNNLRIYGSDVEENLEGFTPNVVELDLSRNLFGSWEDIAFIIKYMGKLIILDVSENRLRIDELPIQLMEVLQNIQELRMVKMEYEWYQIASCVQMMPSLQQLVVSKNKVSCLHDIDLACLQQLEGLNLSSNCINCWNEVLKLGILPKLKTLDLSNCGLEHIYFRDANSTEKSKLFPLLEILRLSDNNYKNWSDVSELDKLQNLVELRMSNNPICVSDKPQTVMQLFIAKIGKLQMLNRIQITSAERRGAELDYLKRYGQAWLNMSSKTNSETVQADFFREHPRYECLVKKHGAVEASELKEKPANISSKTLSLDISSSKSSSKFVKKIPYSMTVHKFKHLLQHLYKTGTEDLTVSYISSKHGNKFILDNDMRNLSFFAIEDGDKIDVTW